MKREDEIKAERLAIEAHQRRLDELLSDVWPKNGDEYWSVTHQNLKLIWCGDTLGETLLSLGLLHRTQEDAQMHHELMKVVQELRECDGFRPFVVEGNNFSFGYDVRGNTILSCCWTERIDNGWEHLYYETRAQSNAALDKVGHERVLKVMQWAAGRGR